MSQWEVGQKVVVRERNYGRGPAREIEATVSRVGRKYVYAVFGRNEIGFRIEDGYEQGDGNYKARLFTPEGVIADLARTDARNRLSNLTRDYGWIGRLSTEQMTRIADVIEEGH